jgi:hypothetical protein
VLQSLSDLNGFDPFIHGGTAEGVFSAVRNMFASIQSPPIHSVADFRIAYDTLKKFRRSTAGRGDPYTAIQFGALAMTARAAVESLTRHDTGSRSWERRD